MTKAELRQSPSDFLASVRRSFDEAISPNQEIRIAIAIAGHPIELRFANRQLSNLLGRAFGHLRTSGSCKPELRVRVSDSVSTGLEMPGPPWRPEDYLARGEIRGYNTGTIRTAFQLGETAALSLLDNESGEAFFWVRNAVDLPYFETGSPLRTILSWWLSRHGLHLVHAAAVGHFDAGVLLVGKGGSGKSTSAIACLNAGMRYVADDYCMVSDATGPWAYSVYGTAKLKGAADLERFPGIARIVSNRDRIGREKALIFVNEHESHRLIDGFPIRAVLAPVVSGGAATRIEPISAAQGITALAPSSIFQNAGAADADFEKLVGIVRKLPCFRLVLGSDIERIPAVIASVLNKP